MTWYCDASGATMDVHDHTGKKIATEREFSGSWAGDYPDEVLHVMEETAVAEYESNGFSDYLMAVLRDAIFQNIEMGTPP
jgi:hypothetical protein